MFTLMVDVSSQIQNEGQLHIDRTGQKMRRKEEHMAHVHYLFNIFGISSDRAAGWEPHLGPVQLPRAMLRLISFRLSHPQHGPRKVTGT
jgi:hypothetical protein